MAVWMVKLLSNLRDHVLPNLLKLVCREMSCSIEKLTTAYDPGANVTNLSHGNMFNKLFLNKLCVQK